jgi:hypothetical protein
MIDDTTAAVVAPIMIDAVPVERVSVVEFRGLLDGPGAWPIPVWRGACRRVSTDSMGAAPRSAPT